MKTVIIIPARYASTRLPGKPLKELTPPDGSRHLLIELSQRAACRVGGVDAVHVATDDSQVGESMQKPSLYWQNNVIRIYVHVCDLVDAHVQGLKWSQSGGGSRVFKVGTDDGFSVRQLIDQAKHVTNRPVPVSHGARRPGDCNKLVSGSLRVKTELERSADQSNLKHMITDAWCWYQKTVAT